MVNNLIASIGARFKVPAKANSIVMNGSVYAQYTWDMLEKNVRSQGMNAVYKGTEVHLEDDGQAKMYRIFSVSATGSFAAYQIAIEA